MNEAQSEFPPRSLWFQATGSHVWCVIKATRLDRTSLLQVSNEHGRQRHIHVADGKLRIDGEELVRMNGKCTRCGCTSEPGRWWSAPDLCTKCAPPAAA